MSDMVEIMNESEFHAISTAILDAIEKQADVWFDELDVELESVRNGNVLTLIFENGSQVVINSQAPKLEMWVAAKRGGFHYKKQGAVWVDGRSGNTLHDDLSAICTEQSGRTLSVSIP